MKKISQKLVLIGFATCLLFLYNRLIFSLSTIKEKLYHSRAHYYQWKFGKIFYTVQGRGSSLLLIHDTSADSSSYEYNKLIDTLAKNHRVYALDLIGYGKSDKPKITYTAYLFVQLLLDFRKNVIREKTSVLTSGRSNAYATMACLQNPEVFNSLIFINPGDFDDLSRNPKRKDKLNKFLIELPVIGTTFYNIMFSRLMIRRSLKNKFYNPIHLKLAYIDTFREAAHLSGSASKYTYASDLCHFNNVNIKEAISKINNNIFIIQGTRTNSDYEALINNYKSLNPAIESSTIDRSKNYPHLEKPESTLEVLMVYLH
ncbi:Alpha/beta hydrolase [Petrocella atlantisensis]|uniref:Alpha/beta hydrolase n=1 Tax=Petrocella atlantisensis TaxID=2173034 RepID=A0A3P7NX08_9FIRM|nr:alpha/beta fold hydrolase [Petrocella atlantisensis]PKM54417.1 MAG: alpha/beta hydrolase [Firmicutes bacterium HGW-Firmicutes-5]VDN47764.1 Alpha/beta hydrolase [Petrocella atlantisensis]